MIALERLRARLLPAQIPSRALVVRQPLAAVIPTPRRVESRYERDVRDDGIFVIEGNVGGWTYQEGQGAATLTLTDHQMNAAMQAGGQANVTLALPIDVANYIPPRTRLRVTVEII